MLLRRFRCVAFAALSAGVTRKQLDEAMRVAQDADTRQRAATAAARHLQLVR